MMRSTGRQLIAALLACSSLVGASPAVVDPNQDVTYHGIDRNGIEIFLNIPYGEDTSGEHRFKPPRPHVPTRGSTIKADSYGPACPQQLRGSLPPLGFTNVTDISEDCLNLNVARPKGTCEKDRLPVMVYIHGGSFWTGHNKEITIAPDGLILESVQNGLPVIHVAMNYRLGFFGFAQSGALKSEKSENAGLRDQRLAIEWVRENIEHFGGDPENITIFGQSSGGLAVGMHLMAYGNTKPVPFQRSICESQALEPGITSTFTIDAMTVLVDYVGCNKTDLHSPATVSCLRNHDMSSLLNASLATYRGDLNVGDIWLPVVDGDFLPAAPSQLIKEGRFAKHVTNMIGWCDNDVTYFTDFSIKTDADTRKFISDYAPTVSSQNLDKLLSLYPVSDFSSFRNLTAEFYRAARVFRDILMTCQPIYYAEHLAAAGNDVYLYDWNQTILDEALEYLDKPAGLGPIHTSEFAYIFGNLSHYDADGLPFHPTDSDFKLRDRGSRTWSTYASVGKPGVSGRDTLQDFTSAYAKKGQVDIFVVGGAHEGLSPIDGPQASSALAAQRLRERCAFINSPEMIEQLRY